LWWISAIILFLIGIGICIFAYKTDFKGYFWKNNNKIQPVNPVNTYQVIQ